jgi:hypothetical protein
MSSALSRMALVAYGLLISTQFAFGGQISCFPDCPVFAVPEPGTLALMATGVGILVLSRFRKRR